MNGPEGALDWDDVVWRTHEEHVARLRRRIFKATREQRWATVRSLQKMMLRSWSNTLLSVRQVTQRNTGRRTAGVDGEVALSSQERAEVAVRVHRCAVVLGPVAGPARVHSQGQWQTAPTRNSGAHGPVSSGAGPQRAGARVGGPVRTTFVWVPPGSQLCRCDRCLVFHAQRATCSTGVDSGCRSVGRVRQNRPHRASRRLGAFPARELVEGWLRAGVIETGSSPRPTRALRRAG